MIIKVGGGLEPLGPIGVYAYAASCYNNNIDTAFQRYPAARELC